MKIPGLLLLCCALLYGQRTFVYTNNDVVAANSVSAFAAADNGTLTPVPGSPFLTGGKGKGSGLWVSNRIATANSKNYLYAANTGSDTVSAFLIDRATGTLTPIPGSPIGTGGSALGPAGNYGISLAVTPDDRFLFAANAGSRDIAVYAIGANGALSPIAGSPFLSGVPAGLSLAGIRITSDGKFLVVGAFLQVLVFRIADNGVPALVPGAPFFPINSVGSVDCNCPATRLYGAAGSGVEAFSMDPNGRIAPLPGSPFGAPGVDNNVLFLTPDDTLLLASDQVGHGVNGYPVLADGKLGLPPGPGIAGGTTVGVATDATGRFGYSAIPPDGIVAFAIGNGGLLTPVSGQPYFSGVPGAEVLSLAVFPPKACCPAPAIGGVSVSPATLWPPNGKFVPVTVQYEASGACPVACRLAVTSSEPGAGQWQVVDSHHVLLRADRDGKGSGREYTIVIACGNSAGRASSAEVKVRVPHDQSGH